MARTKKDSGFSCQECGRKFRTVSGAEKASSVGCPKCGGVDIDLTSADDYQPIKDQRDLEARR